MSDRQHRKKVRAVGILAALVCVAALAGTAYAWFTDTLSTRPNVIQAGNLNVSATVHEQDGSGTVSYAVAAGFMGDEARTLTFSAGGADFNGNGDMMSDDAFEPGKTFVKLIRVTNGGSLAADVRLYVDVTDNGLLQALWFAAASGDETAAIINRTPMADIGTLKDTRYRLRPGGTVDIILAYGMNDDAGIEYQGTSVSVTCSLVATQATAGDGTAAG